MTTIDERLAGLSDKELENLNDNAARLSQSGKPAQKTEAERLLPLIAAELAGRKKTKAADAEAARAKKKETAAATRKAKVPKAAAAT